MKSLIIVIHQKKQILLQAVKDLNGEVENNITLYQLQHRLEKLLNK